MNNFIKYGNYGFTTRYRGCSTGSYDSNNLSLHTNDKKNNIISNRRVLAKSLGFSLDQFVFSNQTHSNNFYCVTSSDKGKGAYCTESAIKNNDALYTFEKGIVLATYHADCTPIFFQSKKHSLIGLIHAGWQGTTREVTYRTLKYIIDTYKIDPKDISVHIGPSISQKNYEIKKDVADKFKKYSSAIQYIENKIYLDTAYANILQLNKLNITNISHDNRCTYENEKLFFSHRREQNSGRMLAFIYQ